MILTKKKHICSGFTLMELVIAMGIIGIIASIAVPSMVKLMPGYRLRSATRDIVSCFQEAKMRAVKENATTAVRFDITNNQYTAWVDNGSNEWALDTDEVVFKQVSLPKDIKFCTGTTSGNNYTGTSFSGTLSHTFRYNSRGLPAQGSTAGGSVFLNNNQLNYRRVVISSAGNIRVQKSKDGTAWVK